MAQHKYTRRIAACSILSALLIVAQVSLAFLPNVELVTLLIILMTVLIGKYALASIGVFVLVEALIYGFGLWVINYLYVWPLLFIISYIFRKQTHPLFFAILSGGFGLCFGAFCSLIYLFIGGWANAVAYWTAGLPFDFIHCVSNTFLTLVLFKPLYKLGNRLLGDIF